MKKILAVSVLAISAFIFAQTGLAKEDPGKSGEELFKQNCSPCHPEGGNIVHPAFTLHKKDREAHGVKNAEDIVGKMRNPGPGMQKFDEKTVPGKDAQKIADYILKTFK